VIADSQAIAGEPASRHPGLALRPADPAARSVARMLVAEMHSGFAALQHDHRMNLRVSHAQTLVTDALRADLARLGVIWTHARSLCAPPGP